MNTLTTTLTPIEAELLEDLRKVIARGWGEIHLEVFDSKVVSMKSVLGKSRRKLDQLQTETVTQ